MDDMGDTLAVGPRAWVLFPWRTEVFVGVKSHNKGYYKF